MNRYKLMFESGDQRLWETFVNAHGITNRDGLVIFWRKYGPFGWFRYDAHYIAADCLISAIEVKEN